MIAAVTLVHGNSLLDPHPSPQTTSEIAAIQQKVMITLLMVRDQIAKSSSKPNAEATEYAYSLMKRVQFSPLMR
jgi:hypothetical protein